MLKRHQQGTANILAMTDEETGQLQDSMQKCTEWVRASPFFPKKMKRQTHMPRLHVAKSQHAQIVIMAGAAHANPMEIPEEIPADLNAAAIQVALLRLLLRQRQESQRLNLRAQP